MSDPLRNETQPHTPMTAAELDELEEHMIGQQPEMPKRGGWSARAGIGTRKIAEPNDTYIEDTTSRGADELQR